jgi:hypothetical protein
VLNLGLERGVFLACFYLLFKKIIVVAPQAFSFRHSRFPGAVWAKGELVWATCDLAQRPEERGQITGCPHGPAPAGNSRFVHTQSGTTEVE